MIFAEVLWYPFMLSYGVFVVWSIRDLDCEGTQGCVHKASLGWGSRFSRRLSFSSPLFDLLPFFANTRAAYCKRICSMDLRLHWRDFGSGGFHPRPIRERTSESFFSHNLDRDDLPMDRCDDIWKEGRISHRNRNVFLSYDGVRTRRRLRRILKDASAYFASVTTSSNTVLACDRTCSGKRKQRCLMNSRVLVESPSTRK
jgi:hypothetical protein